MDWTARVQYLVGAMMRYFLFITTSRLALEPTQSPNQWELELLPQECSGWSLRLTTHHHLMPRMKMHGAIHPLPQYILMA